MPLFSPRIGVVFALVLLSFSGRLLAADSKGKGKPVATDPADADRDFPVQGEYFGVSLNPEYPGQMEGVQVIALGDGRFDAVHYRGGLPGAGWDRQRKWKLSGSSTDSQTELTSKERRLVIRGGLAELSDSTGRRLANLEPIHRISPTQGLAPPPNAIVLFDGTNGDAFDKTKIVNGLLQSGSTTKLKVQDFSMHVEFRTPYKPHGRGQDRGNSGVYIQRRYELQILDSFGLEGVENECGGMYRQRRPLVNMCLPPLSWQTYDIDFTAARFEDGKKVAGARISIRHNGEPIHVDYELTDKTGAGQKEGPDPLPIHFQDHGNPVFFRNIWLVDKTTAPAATPVDSPATPAFVAPAFPGCFRRCWCR